MSTAPRRPGIGAAARAMLGQREAIGRFLDPKLFADPARDILLHLCASEEEGRPVQSTDCAHVAHVPETTSLRWLTVLEGEGLVTRRPDPSDGRRVLITLTDCARTALAAYFGHLERAR